MIKWEHSIFRAPRLLLWRSHARSERLAQCPPIGFDRRCHGLGPFRCYGLQSFKPMFPSTAANPRTQNAGPFPLVNSRPLFVTCCSLPCPPGLFFLASFELNHLAFVLSPVALGIVLFYSYTKRFTRLVASWCWALALGIAPAAAWIAVRGTLDARILLLTGRRNVSGWLASMCSTVARDFDHDSRLGPATP